MSCILNIETSTTVCSVAASQDGQTIFVKEDLKGPSHAVSLGVFVDEALSFIDSHAIPLDEVAVSCGPGSYTGLRIGVSMAKGICYGRNVPLIGLPTLEVLSVPVLLFHVQCTVVDGSIYFHTAGIEHRTEQRIFRQIVIQQYGHTQHFERRKTDQGHIPSVWKYMLPSTTVH